MECIQVAGIDLAKSVFQVCAINSAGKPILNRSFRCNQLLKFFSNLTPCLIGMEACGSAHYWARELQKLGHEVRLMPPQYVKPYVKTNKNDAADAEAICEAVTRPTMRFVTVKSEEQQALLLVHRERDGVVRDRTSLINRIRASLQEFGVSIPSGRFRLHKWFRTEFGLIESDLPVLLSRHIQTMLKRLHDLETYIKELDKQIDIVGNENQQCRSIQDIPGVGRLTSSAIVASVGDAKVFKSGRQFAAWLGLVPNQHSSGGKSVLQGISKRGDAYLRRMLIHGARAVIRHMKPGKPFYDWLQKLQERMHKNKVIVALANKLARVTWAILANNREYKAQLS